MAARRIAIPLVAGLLAFAATPAAAAVEKCDGRAVTISGGDESNRIVGTKKHA
jgi:hypothetical protein